MIEQYSRQARARIDAAVKWVEANRPRLNQLGRIDQKGPAQMVPYAAIAAEDIEHGSFGTISLASAGGWDSAWGSLASRDAEVYNLGPKVWSGANLLVGPAAIAGTDQGDGHKLVILQAWSATRLRGVSTNPISAGGTGVVDTLTEINGHYGLTTASVYLPTVFVEVEAERVIWAELRYRPEGSRWEAYSADCDGGS